MVTVVTITNAKNHQHKNISMAKCSHDHHCHSYIIDFKNVVGKIKRVKSRKEFSSSQNLRRN